MNFLFDTSIDVNRRQFYVLAIGSCIGNLAGFIGNALISDGTEQRFSVESVCYLWPQEVSLELKKVRYVMRLI